MVVSETETAAKSRREGRRSRERRRSSRQSRERECARHILPRALRVARAWGRPRRWAHASVEGQQGEAGETNGRDGRETSEAN
jgi:thymidylate synthase ThyX